MTIRKAFPPTMWRPVAVCVFLAAVAGCARNTSQPSGAGQTGQVAGILLVRDPAQGTGDKVIVASYRFTAQGVEARETMVAFGPANLPRTDASEFRFQLIDRQGAVRAEYGITDPRKVVVEQQGLVEVPEAIYVARLPFNSGAREVRVLNAQGAAVASTDVRAVISGFCADRKQDKDCANVPRP